MSYVRCINVEPYGSGNEYLDRHPITLGKIYKVVSYYSPNDVAVINDDNQKCEYLAYRFKPVIKDLNKLVKVI